MDERAEMLAALKECHALLEMLTEPAEIKRTSALNAWSLAVAAELKVRKILARAEALTPSGGE